MAIGLGPTLILAESSEEVPKDAIVLYQVGEKGKYCVSTTPDTSSCISGVDENKKPINTIDFVLKAKEGATPESTVVFINRSDAPHNMIYTGKEAETSKTQEPGDPQVSKTFKIRDLNTSLVECQFHGKQLAFGNRVPAEITIDSPELEGHKFASDGTAINASGLGGGGQVGTGKSEVRPQALTATKPVDATGSVLENGTPNEIKALVTGNPSLGSALATVNPEAAMNLVRQGVIKDPAVAAAAQSLIVAKTKAASEASKLALAESTSGQGSSADSDKEFRQNLIMVKGFKGGLRVVPIGNGDQGMRHAGEDVAANEGGPMGFPVGPRIADELSASGRAVASIPSRSGGRSNGFPWLIALGVAAGSVYAYRKTHSKSAARAAIGGSMIAVAARKSKKRS